MFHVVVVTVRLYFYIYRRLLLDKSQCIFLPLWSSNRPNWAWVRFFSENGTPKPNVLFFLSWQIFLKVTEDSDSGPLFAGMVPECVPSPHSPSSVLKIWAKFHETTKQANTPSIVFIWPPNNTHFAFSVPLNDREMTNGIRSGWKESRRIRILKEIRLGASPPTSFSSPFWVSYTCYITILICSS